jgi:hypothetical protein
LGKVLQKGDDLKGGNKLCVCAGKAKGMTIKKSRGGVENFINLFVSAQFIGVFGHCPDQGL